VMGMGRTGSAAYDRLAEEEANIMGLDSDPAKARMHLKAGRNVVFADAEDTTFWADVKMPNLKAVVLAMSDIEGKVIAARQLRHKGFNGYIIAHTMFADEAALIKEAGANEAYLTMNETGVALASHIDDYMSRNHSTH
ncbi:NAD-binding protein, partial [Marinobacter sp.]|uniref:NAD-binding protein n=1 Tax=Marinobacter sp. TaxID=50741 RepID=UPI0035C73FC9